VKRIRKVKEKSLIRLRRMYRKRSGWLPVWGPPWKAAELGVRKVSRMLKKHGYRLRTAYRKAVEKGTSVGSFDEWYRLHTANVQRISASHGPSLLGGERQTSIDSDSIVSKGGHSRARSQE